MIKHIVMMKFNDENKNENLKKIKKELECLVDKIDSLQDMEVGLDFMQSERSFDLVLSATFLDKKGLQEYAKHPSHLKVLEQIKKVISVSKVVDYEKN